MDEDISTWIIEFLLRQRIDDKIINGVLSAIPFNDGDYRLKKTLLLRKVESVTSKPAISEKLLDLLETIEELDYRNGKSASNFMKEAYCTVAVDCTVSFLEENVEHNAKYFIAVMRVWTERVCKMESLASEESKLKMGDIEAAVWDSEACAKLLRINTRNEARRAVRVYLEEERRILGPTFLELVAQKVGNTFEGIRTGEPGLVNPADELAVGGDFRKGSASVKQNHIAMKRKRGRGAKIADDNEVDEDEVMGKTDDVPTPEVQRLPDAVEPRAMELDATREDNLLNDIQTAQTLRGATDNRSSKTIVENQTCPKDAIRDDNLPNDLQTSQPLPEATDDRSSKPILEKQTYPKMHSTPDIDRVQEALKLSSKELHAAVRDPLPDALRIAQTLSYTGACVDKQNVEKEQPGSSGNESQLRMKSRDGGRLMFMEPNGTAQTFEWNDSIDNMPEDSPKRPRLPSPTESKHSPLKTYEEKQIVIRRPRKKWTVLEEDTLRTGVKKFGKGNWKLILLSYHEIFQDRTEVDLKDKWRNMCRYS